ncbi:acyl-CoA dehydrogenase family protein [Actinosynnema sp. NPDC047251]|uniref:short-chain 2-methylacyl-CoA dehydrogenase n=1 Tax=Saccharothrix espanaensis (strain ATCC 51144 / DSM 44229 / JCM 9112 / NBRC 15066 / NRRL 15764) TaxID=1179773 RepID=K0K380_SACES|nr:acyl-CoA dehydrogenase family protein [Saccharothrix espanaensis]CCH32766.1 Acyl-coenzyme A dehydrogenase [Saccharothrix espanaensis DSM 44229]
MQAASGVTRRAELLDEEEALRDTVGKWAREKLRPRVDRMDRDARIPRDLIDELFALGLMGVQIPERFGGAGGSVFMSALAIAELARVDPSVAVCVDVQNVLVNTALIRWGSPAQQERHLPRLARDLVGAYALTESESGSDAFALRARARREGGDYVLDGRKVWTTNAREAGLFVVFANAAPEHGVHGITAFLVPRDAPGLDVGPNEEKLGIRASSTCEVRFDGVRVPLEDRLGEEGDGYDIAVDTLNIGRIGIAAQMVGLATGALEAAVEYADQRRQFGQPISGFQGVQLPLARVATDIEAARLLVHDTARLADGGGSVPEMLSRCAMAKYFASQVAGRAASQAVQTFGGNGFSTAYPVEKFYRDAMIGQIYEGTSNILLRTIAGGVLGASRSRARGSRR